MFNNFDKNDPELKQLLLDCMQSTKVFAKTFFPEEVSSDFSILHDLMFQVIDHSIEKKKALAAPRGLGKTTIAKIRAVKAIVFREVAFIVYLSNSEGSAVAATEHIKRMLQSNEALTTIFGKPTFSQKGFKDSFSKQSWVAYGDVFVLPRGSGQQVRGQNWMGNRPGLIIIDDLESTELIRSDDQREKLSNWFFSDLMKSESKFGTRAEFVYIDTIKHEDALLQNLIDSPDWLKVNTPDKVLAICDQDFNTYDPNYMTTEEIKEEYRNHQGKTDLFYMEYMNIPISLKDAVFKEEYFKYYEESYGFLIVYNHPKFVQQQNKMGFTVKEIEKIPVKELISITLCDPARTINLLSAESSVVTVSIHRKSRKILVREGWGKRVRPTELYDEMFRQVLLYGSRYLGVEVTGLHEFISQPIKQEIKTRQIYPQYIELHAKGEKDMRISRSLETYYKNGQIYHNPQTCTALENQLKWHPKSKRKDLIDALAYITKVIDDEYLFFESEEDDYYDEYDDINQEDEFEDEYEDLDEDWRIA